MASASVSACLASFKFPAFISFTPLSWSSLALAVSSLGGSGAFGASGAAFGGITSLTFVVGSIFTGAGVAWQREAWEPDRMPSWFRCCRSVRLLPTVSVFAWFFGGILFDLHDYFYRFAGDAIGGDGQFEAVFTGFRNVRMPMRSLVSASGVSAKSGAGESAPSGTAGPPLPMLLRASTPPTSWLCSVSSCHEPVFLAGACVDYFLWRESRRAASPLDLRRGSATAVSSGGRWPRRRAGRVESAHRSALRREASAQMSKSQTIFEPSVLRRVAALDLALAVEHELPAHGIKQEQVLRVKIAVGLPCSCGSGRRARRVRCRTASRRRAW